MELWKSTEVLKFEERQKKTTMSTHDVLSDNGKQHAGRLECAAAPPPAVRPCRLINPTSSLSLCDRVRDRNLGRRCARGWLLLYFCASDQANMLAILVLGLEEAEIMGHRVGGENRGGLFSIGLNA